MEKSGTEVMYQSQPPSDKRNASVELILQLLYVAAVFFVPGALVIGLALIESRQLLTNENRSSLAIFGLVLYIYLLGAFVRWLMKSGRILRIQNVVALPAFSLIIAAFLLNYARFVSNIPSSDLEPLSQLAYALLFIPPTVALGNLFTSATEPQPRDLSENKLQEMSTGQYETLLRRIADLEAKIDRNTYPIQPTTTNNARVLRQGDEK